MWSTLRTLFILGKVLRWSSRKVDYAQAFPQAEPDENEHIYTYLPREFHVNTLLISNVKISTRTVTHTHTHTHTHTGREREMKRLNVNNTEFFFFVFLRDDISKMCFFCNYLLPELVLFSFSLSSLIR